MGSAWGGVRVTGSSTSSRLLPLTLLARSADPVPRACLDMVAVRTPFLITVFHLLAVWGQDGLCGRVPIAPVAVALTRRVVRQGSIIHQRGVDQRIPEVDRQCIARALIPF